MGGIRYDILVLIISWLKTVRFLIARWVNILSRIERMTGRWNRRIRSGRSKDRRTASGSEGDGVEFPKRSSKGPGSQGLELSLRSCRVVETVLAIPVYSYLLVKTNTKLLCSQVIVQATYTYSNEPCSSYCVVTHGACSTVRLVRLGAALVTILKDIVIHLRSFILNVKKRNL